MKTKIARWKLRNSSGQIGIPQEGVEWLMTLQREENVVSMGISEDGKYFNVVMEDKAEDNINEES